MGKYLATFRPLNLLFIALAQVVSAYFLDFSATAESLMESGIHWLILGTASSAAFGYWLNDHLDVKRDEINGIIRFTANSSSRLNYIHFLIFISISLYCGRMLGAWFFTLFVLTLFILFLYNKWLKDFMLIGNVVVSVLCFVSLYAVYKLIPDIDFLLMFYFSSLAGLVTLAREMVKDIEDIVGDRASGARTLPIELGQKGANIFIYIVLFFTLSFIIVSLFTQRDYLATPLQYVYYAYVVVFILIPLYWAAVNVRYAKENSEFALLSRLLKYVIFVGILSILFF